LFALRGFLRHGIASKGEAFQIFINGRYNLHFKMIYEKFVETKTLQGEFFRKHRLDWYAK